MIEGLREIFDLFRAGKRTPDSYKLFRAIKQKLETIADDLSPLAKDRESIVQDLENLAYKRAGQKYPWFKDSYIWKRPHMTRYTNIRYDFHETVEGIARSDNKLKDFLINCSLLEIISEYEHGEIDDDGKRAAFWTAIKEEVNDNCKKVSKSK